MYEGKFCPTCGTPAPVSAPARRQCFKCGAALEADARFCPVCGEAVSPDAPVSAPARRQCFKCGAVLEADARFCPVCGEAVSPDAPVSAPAAPVGAEEGREKPADGQPPAVLPPTAGCQASAATASTEGPDTYASDFTGGAFALFFINLLTVFVTIVTLTLAYPAMKCWQMRWEVKHTLVNGRRLVFDGKAGQLFGKYVLWLFLSVITLGIYFVFAMRMNLIRWRVQHTHVEGVTNGRSQFTGKAWGLLGVNIVSFLVTLVTLSFGAYWAFCYTQRWYASHTVIDGEAQRFDGKAGQLFGKALLWMLLTVVTVCIYGFWLPVKIKKWIATHTKFDHPQTFLPPSADMIAAASAAKQPRQTQQTLAEQLVLKKAKDARACCIMGFVMSLVFLVMLVVGLAVLASVGGSEALGSPLDWKSIMVVTVIGSMSIGTSARGVALRKYDLPKSHLILGIVGLVLGVLLTLGMYGSTYWFQIVLLFRHL